MGTTEANNQEDAMAAMMAEMAGNAADENLVIPDTETLSQDEIDSLLGFGDANSGNLKGVDALTSKKRDNYEKFPMLEVIFDRFARSAQTTLRSFTGENCEVNIENITSLRFEDYLNTIPLPTMISIYQAVEWENLGLITIESSLIYELVDILLGGGGTKGSASFRVEGRPFTAIEQDMMKSFTRIILDEMTQSFTPITTISYRFERLETNPRFATITRPVNPIVIISCRIEFDGHGGKIDIVFPYATLEPVKDLLTQMFAGENFGSDASWESFFASEIKTTNVKLSAKLKHKVINLRNLAELKVGSTLVMENFPDDDIDVDCNGISVFKGKIGSYGDKLAISITNAKQIKDLV